MTFQRHCEIKRQWADAVECFAEDCDDWPVERIVQLEYKIKHLRDALRDCMSYVDCDNLTTLTKQLRWQYVVDGGEWIKGNCKVDTPTEE